MEYRRSMAFIIEPSGGAGSVGKSEYFQFIFASFSIAFALNQKTVPKGATGGLFWAMGTLKPYFFTRSHTIS